MTQSPSAVILEPKKIVCHFFHFFSPSICHEVIGPDATILVFLNVEFQASFFTLLFYFHQETHFLFTFCHKGGVICISEVIDISPDNLDSSLCFIQLSIYHDLLCMRRTGREVKIGRSLNMEGSWNSLNQMVPTFLARRVLGKQPRMLLEVI